MNDYLIVALLLVAGIALDIAAILFGVDTRDGFSRPDARTFNPF